VTPVRSAIYLHGFASSPASSKAQRFGRELAALGIGFGCPDLNEPDFETLTITRMIGVVRKAAADALAPTALIGSSLGGFVALHAGAPKVDRLVLLAPAVDFGGGRLTRFGGHTLEDWRRGGRVPVWHYGWNREEMTGFGLYEDALQYDAFTAPATVPTLVFQGRFDEVVSPASVEGWAKDRPRVDLRMLDDDHQLSASVDVIWEETRKFLGLGSR
jgi:pimeloyl-ACP methyl ester carboxylesterase